MPEASLRLRVLDRQLLELVSWEPECSNALGIGHLPIIGWRDDHGEWFIVKGHEDLSMPKMPLHPCGAMLPWMDACNRLAGIAVRNHARDIP